MGLLPEKRVPRLRLALIGSGLTSGVVSLGFSAKYTNDYNERQFLETCWRALPQNCLEEDMRR